jgi:hypothetical protein
MVEGWWYKQVSILVDEILLSKYLLAGISLYQTQLTYASVPKNEMHKFKVSSSIKLLMWGSRLSLTVGTAN